MGKFAISQPLTPALGTARDSAELEDALVWVCRDTATDKGYHPTGGEPRIDLYEDDGDWWIYVMINVAEDAPIGD